jgi:hypothetical protein
MKLHSHAVARALRNALWEAFQQDFKVVQDGSLRDWALGLTPAELPAMLVALQETEVNYQGKALAEVIERFHVDILLSVSDLTNPEADKRPIALSVANWIIANEIAPNLTEFQLRSQRVVAVQWNPPDAADLIDLTKAVAVRLVVEIAYYTP